MLITDLLPSMLPSDILKRFRQVAAMLIFASSPIFAMELHLNASYENDTITISPTAECDCEQTFIYKLTSKKHSASGVSTSSQSGRFTTQPHYPVMLSHLRLNLSNDTHYILDLIVTDIDGRPIGQRHQEYP